MQPSKDSIFSRFDSEIGDAAPKSAWFAYRMRWKRRRLLWRSLRKRRELSRVSVKEATIAAAPILCFMTLRNEMLRLEHYLAHYRALGVGHFLVVDNTSDDGSAAFLAAQPDVSVWCTDASYKQSRFGVDWLTCLQFKFGVGKWCLTADADEILVLPGGADLAGLTGHLDRTGRASFGVVMLDCYPKGAITDAVYAQGDHPVDTLRWFDADNFRAERHRVYDNLVLRGGVRDRCFFENDPGRAPTLNKTPLVKWRRGTTYVSSTHQILPRALNDVYSTGRPSGVFLHSKFLPDIGAKSSEEMRRQQHFENSALYADYYHTLVDNPVLWNAASVEYQGPDQLEALGLMTSGDMR